MRQIGHETGHRDHAVTKVVSVGGITVEAKARQHAAPKRPTALARHPGVGAHTSSPSRCRTLPEENARQQDDDVPHSVASLSAASRPLYPVIFELGN